LCCSRKFTSKSFFCPYIAGRDIEEEDFESTVVSKDMLSLEDYYNSQAITALTKILEDPLLAAYHRDTVKVGMKVTFTAQDVVHLIFKFNIQ